MKAERIRTEEVIDAAIKRFSYFGIGKTTLTEVAEDLSLTKQALAYYFPDKHSLVKAVMDKLTGAYLAQLRTGMEAGADTETSLMQLVEVKAYYLKTYFMLVVQADQAELLNKPLLSWKQYLQERELELVTAVFRRGVASGELQPIDTSATAVLFLETLYAFSRCLQEKGSLPDEAAMDLVFTRQREVIRLFYKGIKTNNGSHDTE